MRSEGDTRSAAVPGALTALLADLARAPPSEGWSAPALPGERVGRFVIVRTVGRGGFGVVYEARDLELGRAVALKAIRAGTGEAACDRLAVAEADAAARLAHPNIVHLYELGRCDRGAFLVMELLRGESVAARLARGPLPPREAVRVALEIARGLAHAHAQGVVHRDLKPANVFLCQDGQVKVLDFGLARVFGRAGAGGGTPDYMAPEQARGEPGDERSDLYALGVVAFELLAGRRPRGAEAPPGAPAALARLVPRLLAAEPAARPASAEEVCARLGAIAESLARRPLVRSTLAVAALSLGGAVAFAVLWQRPLPPGRLLTLAADTANATGDPDLDAAGSFLSLALDQSRRLTLVSRSRTVNLLAGNGEAPGRVDEAAARRAARLAGATLLLVPEVAAEGTLFSVGVRVVEVARGEPAFSVRETATGKGSLPDAVDRLAARLLERLGGEPAGALGARVPVGAIVPVDPEAWRHVEASLRLNSEGREVEAEDEMRQVLAVDPENPLAHHALMIEARFRGHRQEALHHAEIARRNIARLPARERALVEAELTSIHGGSDDELLRRLDEVIAAWPEDPRAYQRAAITLLNHDGDVARMRPYLEKALAVAALRPGLRVSFLAALGRLDEALEVARRYADRHPSDLSYLYLAAVHRWRGEAAEALAAGRRSCELDTTPVSPTQRWNFVEADALEELEPIQARWPVPLHWLALRGRWREAVAALDREAVAGADHGGQLGWYRSQRASFLALGGGGSDAVWREVEAQLALGHEGLGCNVLWLALAGDLERARRLRDAVSPAESMGCVRAYRALELEGRGEREAALARWTALYGHGTDYHQGRLLLGLGRDREAVEAFRRYRRKPDHPLNQQAMPWSAAFYPWSLYLEADALVRLGDEPEALRLLDRLGRLWDRADGGAPFVRESAALRARLAARGRGGAR